MKESKQHSQLLDKPAEHDRALEIEKIANELDSIADGLATTNMIRGRQVRDIVRRLVAIARNEQRTQPEGDGK